VTLSLTTSAVAGTEVKESGSQQNIGEVYHMSLSPGAVNVNTPTKIHITILLRHLQVRPSVVTIERLGPNGSVAELGQLNDKGADGDILADDGNFAGNIQITEDKTGVVNLRASVIAGGAKLLSPLERLTVLPKGAPTKTVMFDSTKTHKDPKSGAKYVANEVNVCVSQGAGYKDVLAMAKAVNGTVVGNYSEVSCYQIRLPEGTSVPSAVEKLRRLDGVKDASPNWIGSFH
jgi:hypothetical protein